VYIAYVSGSAFPTVRARSHGRAQRQRWLGKFALCPSFTWASRWTAALGDGPNRYLGFNARPALRSSSRTPARDLAFPLQVGISAGDYYEVGLDSDETFGFFKGGAVLSVPLAFIPSDYGAWSVSGGASIYAFGTNLKQINVDDTPWVVGTWASTGRMGAAPGLRTGMGERVASVARAAGRCAASEAARQVTRASPDGR
jgi:hypothetical protein